MLFDKPELDTATAIAGVLLAIQFPNIQYRL